MKLAEALAPVVDLVYPPRCPFCGEGLSAQTGLCGACWNELAIAGEPACASCARPFGDSIDHGAICAACLAEPPKHDGLAAATLYNDASRRLVLSFKHGNRIALAPMMARLMKAKLEFLDASWLVVPVPLHRWRLWRRGFNQAAVLAQEVARQTGAQVIVDALVRRKATPVLGGLGAQARVVGCDRGQSRPGRANGRCKRAARRRRDDERRDQRCLCVRVEAGGRRDGQGCLLRAGARRSLVNRPSTKTPGAKPRAFS